MIMIRYILLICCLFPLSLLAQINTEQVTLMGRHALYFDDYLTAIRYFNKVIETKPYLDKPYYYRAYAKFSLEDFLGAEADCNKCLERNPYLTEVYQLRGLCRIHNKDLKGAAADYAAVLKDEPTEQTALYNRALCLMQEKNYDEAETDIVQLLKIAPRHVRAYMVRSQLSMERCDTLGAIVWADSLLTITQRDASAWSLRGRLALAVDEFEKADTCFTKAVDLEPEWGDHYMMRAQARHAINRFDEAIADYNKVISYIPHHFVAHYNRGLLLATVGRDNEAIEDFNYVLTEEPTNTLARYNRALLMERTGDYQTAVSDLTLLIKDFPNFIYGYMLRAECLRRLGDEQAAKRDEAFVQRAGLDLRFGKQRQTPVRKVITRTEKSLENYQQLVEEVDTVNTLLNELIGRVQNLQAERTPLGLIKLQLAESAQSEYFYHEVARINAHRVLPLRLVISVQSVPQIAPSLYERVAEQLYTLLDGPTLADALVLRSVIQSQRYNFSDALDDAKGALMNDSTSVCAMLQRCAVNCQLAQAETDDKPARRIYLAAAENDANQLLQLTNSEWAPAYYNRAVIYTLQGRKAEAIADYDQAIRLDERLAPAYFNRALLYYEDGKHAESEADLSRAGELGIYKAYSLLKALKQ